MATKNCQQQSGVTKTETTTENGSQPPPPPAKQWSRLTSAASTCCQCITRAAQQAPVYKFDCSTNFLYDFRFNPERKADMNPLAWMPFGGGPRNCVGMRFALLEMKIAMAKILKFYAIHKCEETKIPLPVAKISFRSPSEGIYVTLSKRQKWSGFSFTSSYVRTLKLSKIWMPDSITNCLSFVQISCCRSDSSKAKRLMWIEIVS